MPRTIVNSLSLPRSLNNISTGDSTGGSKLKNNYSATTAPTINDDSTAGYSIGSQWIDITSDSTYICTSSAFGAATWKRTDAGSPSPGGADGAIQFTSGGGTAFSGQSTELYWNSSTHRMGIGTDSPTVELDVNGSIAVANNFVQSGLWRQRVDTSQLLFEYYNGSSWITRLIIE